MVTQAVSELEEVFRAHQACVLKAAYRITGSMAMRKTSRNPSSSGWPAGLSTRAVSPICRVTYTGRRSHAALDLIRSRGHREVVPVERADELQSNSSASPERALSSWKSKIGFAGNLPL